eukprot:6152213-Pleurochrysis_carterae.AAC.1
MRPSPIKDWQLQRPGLVCAHKGEGRRSGLDSGASKVRTRMPVGCSSRIHARSGQAGEKRVAQEQRGRSDVSVALLPRCERAPATRLWPGA